MDEWMGVSLIGWVRGLAGMDVFVGVDIDV